MCKATPTWLRNAQTAVLTASNVERSTRDCDVAAPALKRALPVRAPPQWLTQPLGMHRKPHARACGGRGAGPQAVRCSVAPPRAHPAVSARATCRERLETKGKGWIGGRGGGEEGRRIPAAQRWSAVRRAQGPSPRAQPQASGRPRLSPSAPPPAARHHCSLPAPARAWPLQ